MGIPSWPQILILLVIVLLIFGTKRVRNIGSDLGGAIREFRKGVSDDHDPAESADNGADQNGSGSTRES